MCDHFQSKKVLFKTNIILETRAKLQFFKKIMFYQLLQFLEQFNKKNFCSNCVHGTFSWKTLHNARKHNTYETKYTYFCEGIGTSIGQYSFFHFLNFHRFGTLKKIQKMFEIEILLYPNNMPIRTYAYGYLCVNKFRSISIQFSNEAKHLTCLMFKACMEIQF